MPNYKLSFHFRQYERGWSESFYVVDAHTIDVLHSAFRAGGIPPVMGPRDASVVLQAVSIREDSNNRNAQTVRYQARKPGVAVSQAVPDVVEVSATMRLNSAAGKGRGLWIRGLNDNYTERDAVTGTSIQGQLRTQINAYLSYMQQFGACVRYQITPTGGGLQNWQNVMNFSPSTENSLWTTVTVPAGTVLPAVGDLILFRGLENPRFLYLRGNFRVMSHPATANTFTVPARYREMEPKVDAANTQFRKLTYGYSPITAPFGDFILGRHDTGKPLVTARGRRSPVIRRR